jgi:hypothetical protein
MTIFNLTPKMQRAHCGQVPTCPSLTARTLRKAFAERGPWITKAKPEERLFAF